MNGIRGASGAILIWNLLGVAACAMQVTADRAALARSDPIGAQAFAAMPGWAWAAYFVAVIAGTVGAVLLIMRRRKAVALFALSLMGVVVQFGWTFLVFGLGERKGWGTAILPLLIFAIGVAQLLYARRVAHHNLLT